MVENCCACLGDLHSDTRKAKWLLSEQLRTQGELKEKWPDANDLNHCETKVLFQEALDMKVAARGADDAETRIMAMQLACILCKEGKGVEAKELWESFDIPINVQILSITQMSNSLRAPKHFQKL